MVNQCWFNHPKRLEKTVIEPSPNYDIYHQWWFKSPFFGASDSSAAQNKTSFAGPLVLYLWATPHKVWEGQE
jgi:hypothetical protein